MPQEEFEMQAPSNRWHVIGDAIADAKDYEDAENKLNTVLEEDPFAPGDSRNKEKWVIELAVANNLFPAPDQGHDSAYEHVRDVEPTYDEALSALLEKVKNKGRIEYPSTNPS